MEEEGRLVAVANNRVMKRHEASMSRLVAFRLRPEDYDRLAAVVASTGVPLSALVRAATLDAVDAVRPVAAPEEVSVVADAPLASPEEVRALRTAVNKVGVNVNQIARLSNRHGTAVITPEDDPEAYTALLEEAVEVLREVRSVLVTGGGDAR